jgi:hypothetical protein
MTITTNGRKPSTLKQIIIKEERKGLELKRAKAASFMKAYGETKNATVSWQMVNLDPHVQKLEDQHVLLVARRAALQSLRFQTSDDD